MIIRYMHNIGYLLSRYTKLSCISIFLWKTIITIKIIHVHEGTKRYTP